MKEFDLEEDEVEEEDESEDAAIRNANKLTENACNRDLVISLFWEEKIVLIVRVLQLYSLLFFLYYEYWPSVTRTYFTPFFASVNFSFHLLF